MEKALLLSDVLGSRKGAAATYTISGAVTGDVVEGVTITLTGDASDSTTSAGDGTYSFTGLVDGSYTVTPSLASYSFSPTSTNVTISGGDQTGKNFTSTQVNPILPAVFVWAEGTTPDDNADWSNLIYPGVSTPSGATNQGVSTLASWNPYSGGYATPPALSDRQILYNSATADNWCGWHYDKWNADGLSLDISRGIRLQGMFGYDASPWDMYFWISVKSNASEATGDSLRWYGDPSSTGWREVVAGVRQDARADSSILGSDSISQAWLVASIEVPAGGTGNVTLKLRAMNENTSYDFDHSEQYALVADWSEKTLDTVVFGCYDRATYQCLFNYLWVGTASDDWPI